MIAIEFYDGQGLGNQLWLYAASRSIAETLQLPHVVLHPERFKGAKFLDIDHVSGQTIQLQSQGELATVALFNFHERIFYDHELDYFASDFDSSVLTLKPDTKLHGLFQSEDYFFGNLALPKKYIRVRPVHLQRELVSDDCCVLNLRGGEYKRHKKLILPESYWQNAMHHMRDLFGLNRFLVVTDDRRYAKALFPKLPVLQGSVTECYVALYQAKYLILSNTSFSYFPVKTALDKRFVIAPMHWARFGNQYGRWASPANLYESWMWQDANGLLHSYADCRRETEATRAHYRDHYYLSTVPAAVMNPSISRYVPTGLKKPIKRGLSLLLPKRIG